jgi:hypothetical protein
MWWVIFRFETDRITGEAARIAALRPYGQPNVHQISNSDRASALKSGMSAPRYGAAISASRAASVSKIGSTAALNRRAVDVREI